MVGIIVITHDRLADELVNATKLIVGALKGFAAISIKPDESVEEVSRRISKALKEVDDGSGTLMLTDLFGGTPSNLSLSFLKDGKVEVLSGVNLPMMLTLATSRDEKPLPEVAQMALTSGKKNIFIASELLARKIGRQEKE